MTFEEFFTKKRIDLKRLRRAKPDLYEEFRDHYAQMSERSFDHTKKYWFNRLRKEFLLEVAETPKAVVEKTAPVTASGASMPTAAAAKPAGLPSVSPPGFKPRFKPNVVKPPMNSAGDSNALSVNPVADDKPIVPNTKPVGFKPRFKPGVTPPPTNAKSPAGGDNAQPAKPKPQAKSLGFKPRFKAGATPVTKPDSEGERNEKPKPDVPESTTGPSTGTTPKPLGFKPRFNAGKTTNKKGDAT